MNNENEFRTTRPTLETLLVLVREVRQSQDSLQQGLERVQRKQEEFQQNQAQFQQNQSQFAERLDELIEQQKETKLRVIKLGSKIDALNRNRLEADADFQDLTFRVEELENKTP